MKKVLFVCGQEFILDQKDGGKKCAYRNYCLLKEVYGEENVYAYIFTNDYDKSDKRIRREKSHASFLRKIFYTSILRPFFSVKHEQNLFSYIQSQGFELVCFERTMFGPLIRKLKKRNIRTQIFCENIERNYVAKKVKEENIGFLLPYIATALNEKITVKYADSIICLTNRDSLLLKDFYKKNCDAIIPMTFKDEVQNKNLSISIEENCKELLFIGSYFQPNYDGIKWFITTVMKKLPEYTLLIIGKNFEKKREELTRENVKVIGTVKNLETIYAKNCAVVMPILYGDGMKIKTAEAMMYGKIIIASDEALEGYEISDVDGIYRCNSSEEYISVIKEVYKRKNVGYAQGVRSVFLDKYENSNAIKIYRNCFLR